MNKEDKHDLFYLIRTYLLIFFICVIVLTWMKAPLIIAVIYAGTLLVGAGLLMWFIIRPILQIKRGKFNDTSYTKRKA